MKLEVLVEKNRIKIMSYLEISRIITLVASVAITLGLYHQAFKIWQTMSAKDFTWTIIIALLLNELAWLNYGFALLEWPIIVIAFANVPAVIIASIGYFRYRK